MNAYSKPVMDLAMAIAIVKAAGYTVTKPRAKRVKLTKVGPTFVADWSDGIRTRMSIHTNDEKPDLERAIKVSRAAYESRTKGLGFATMTQGTFERDGETLHHYGPRELKAAWPAIG